MDSFRAYKRSTFSFENVNTEAKLYYEELMHYFQDRGDPPQHAYNALLKSQTRSEEKG